MTDIAELRRLVAAGTPLTFSVIGIVFNRLPALLDELETLRAEMAQAQTALSLAGFGGGLLAQAGAVVERVRALEADVESKRDALAKAGNLAIDILRRRR